MRFITNVFSTLIGLCLFFGLLFVAIIGITAALGSSDTVSVKDNSVLVLDLSKVKYDYAGKFNYKDLGFNEEPKTGVSNIIKALESAKDDDRIKGITLINQKNTLGFVQLREIRQELENFKESGKFVMSYGDYFSQRDYYLNSVADSVYLNPLGLVDFKGLAVEILYLKGLQEKTGIKMEVLRHGKYKSAVEPYLEDKMSQANYLQTSEFLNSIWSTIVQDIATSRNVSVESLNKVATNLDGRDAQLALENKLIDKVAYLDEFNNSIKKTLSVDFDKPYNKIEILEYIKAPKQKNEKLAKDQIAIIYAQGQILNGEGNVNYIGEGAINRALEKARNNNKVKAVVLRVNSPGGSALTSELIWREVELTKGVKPVVVSMGDYAASGGYYIACGADYIFADPTTITGSIGVFGMLPNFSELTQKYGVNPQGVQTHDNQANYSPFAPMTLGYKQYASQGIEQIYSTFVKRVAQGRSMSEEKVNEIAQGRVWTGEDALENGLIDAYGSLQTAVSYAADLVEVDQYRVVNYPEYELNFDDFLRSYFGSSLVKTQDQLIIDKIGQENFQMLERLNYFSSLKGAQAIIPFEIHMN